MNAHDAGNPSRRRLLRANGNHPVHEFHRVRFLAAEIFREQQPKAA